MKNSNERILRLLQATPVQLGAIDRVLEGRSEATGPLTMRIQQAADYLGVHRATINRLMKAGRLTPVPVLGSIRVRRDELEAIAFGRKAESASRTGEGGGK